MRKALSLVLLLASLSLALRVALVGGCSKGIALDVAAIAGKGASEYLVGTVRCPLTGFKSVPIKDLKVLEELKPDVVIAPASLKGKLSGNVIYVNFTTPEKYKESVLAIAKVFGTEKRAEEVIKYAMEEWKANLWDLSGKPKVWSNVAGWRALVREAGGVPSSPKDADVVIVAEGSGVPRAPATYELWRLANGTVLQPFAFQAFAKALWPARNKFLDPNSNAQKFLERFLGISNIEVLKKVEVKPKLVKIRDVLGREILVPSPARRVAILYGLEDWVAVGGEQALVKVVALNAWRYKKWRPDWWVAWTEHYPWLKDVPDVGQPGWNFDLEKLLKAKPDVVVTTPWMFKHMEESGALGTLKALGIPVVVIDFVPKTTDVKEHLEVVRTSLIDLGVLAGNLKRAEELYKFYLKQFDTVLNKLKHVKERPKVIVFATWSPWKVYGAKGHVSTWVELAKGDNVAAKVVPGASGYVNPEFVLETNPDVIIFVCNNNFPDGQKVVIGYTVSSPLPALEALEKLIDRPGWEQLKAVREKRVYMMHLGLAHGHVFQFAALQFIAKWLHPEIFKGLEPLQNLKEFYEEFMPYPLRGVWVVSLADAR